MAATVSSRPSTWSAVKNPVIYKFATTGGPFTNYRIEVEVFKASDDSSLTGGVKFAFSPDGNADTYVDVSTIIKAYLKPEWIEPSALNELEADTSLKFYIKYQELYDGSATSVVDDVANPRYAVLSGLQIPSPVGNDLDAYVPEDDEKKFLTLFDRPKIWRGYPATLSFIHPNDTGLWVQTKQFDASGELLSEDLQQIDADEDDGINRLDLLSGITLNDATKTLSVQLFAADLDTDLLTNPTFVTALTPWANVAGAGADWSHQTPDRARCTLAAGAATSDPLRQDISDADEGWYFLRVSASISVDNSDNITVNAYNNGSLVTEVYNETTALTSTLSNLTTYTYIEGTFDRIELVASKAAGDGHFVNINRVSLHPLAAVTEELTFDVEDPCDNPILLFWKNSLGGDAWWLFEYGQESGYNYSGQKKAKRMMLFADHLTLPNWEAISELNTLGEVYQENIVQLTSSINRTAIRDGAQVYVVNEDGDKTGVVAIPTNSVIHTRDVTHSIEIEIEYPERI